MVDEDFREIAERADAEYRAEITRAYGDENAGRETGRMKRHLPGEASPEAAQKRRDEDARRIMSALEQLLLDPIYRAKYEAFGIFLSEAETKADTLIEQAEIALAAVNAEIADAIDTAPKLNGKAIFRFTDGGVIDEDGNEIPPEQSQGIVWPDGATSAEEFTALLDKRENADTQLRDLYNFRTDLGDLRDRYEDDGNPITLEGLDQIESETEQHLTGFDRPLVGTAPQDAPTHTLSSVPTDIPKL